MYVYIYIYIYIYILYNINTCVCIYVYIYIYINIRIFIFVFVVCMWGRCWGGVDGSCHDFGTIENLACCREPSRRLRVNRDSFLGFRV